ncbi:MAG: hypothetical protein ABSH09_27735 [Bryobacteraceae bacterium]
MQDCRKMRRGPLQVELLLFAACATGFLNAQTTPQKLLWHDPGDVSKADLGGSVGTGIGAPQPPFTFIKEDMSGTQPKVQVKDGAGRIWVAKFGNEVKPECFTWRIPVAAGYYVEPSYYIASAQFLNAGAMQRKTPSIQRDGHFKDARFQIRDPNFKYLDDRSWKWAGNPFAGSKELKGLEILIMLASNWDNKDGTALPGDSNTGIFERVVNGRHELIYSFTDWGSGMGLWGDKGGQSDWACADYSRQTSDFVKGVVNGQVVFGYDGHHNDDFKTNIHPADVAWLMKYLGQLRDEQLRAALQASGATSSEVTCFTKAIRTRIEQLKKVSGSP